MQANIKEAEYGIDFFKRFDIVLNGLDNLEARRHVNRLCLAAKVPLVESGTAGYLGQVVLAAVGMLYRSIYLYIALRRSAWSALCKYALHLLA